MLLVLVQLYGLGLEALSRGGLDRLQADVGHEGTGAGTVVKLDHEIAPLWWWGMTGRSGYSAHWPTVGAGDTAPRRVFSCPLPAGSARCGGAASARSAACSAMAAAATVVAPMVPADPLSVWASSLALARSSAASAAARRCASPPWLSANKASIRACFATLPRPSVRPRSTSRPGICARRCRHSAGSADTGAAPFGAPVPAAGTVCCDALPEPG